MESQQRSKDQSHKEAKIGRSTDGQGEESRGKRCSEHRLSHAQGYEHVSETVCVLQLQQLVITTVSATCPVSSISLATHPLPIYDGESIITISPSFFFSLIIQFSDEN